MIINNEYALISKIIYVKVCLYPVGVYPAVCIYRVVVDKISYRGLIKLIIVLKIIGHFKII